MLELENTQKCGLYIPPNSLARGTAIRLLLPKLCEPYKLPDFKPVPLHVAVGYDAYKYKDVMELSAKYPNAIMKYGFFTSDIPGAAKLIAKTTTDFENRTLPTTYDEKMVIQLVKSKDEGYLAFCELGPSFMSTNAVEGENDCKLFFPSDYDRPEEPPENKKKSRRKNKPKPMEAAVDAENPNQQVSISETVDIESCQGEENHLEEDDDDKLEADKATSPIELDENTREPL